MNLFHSAAVRLTLFYLLLIMSLSISFSIAVFNLSSRELNRGWNRPPEFVIIPDDIRDFEQYRLARLTDSHKRLKTNLTMLNLVTLVAGGVLSYYLARRTLLPIEEAMEAQKRFTADASHELRTPLTAMQTEIEVALRSPKLSAVEARQLLGSNLEEVAKLRGLADNLLKLAKNSAASLSLTQLNLREITAEAVRSVDARAKLKQINIVDKVPKLNIIANRQAAVEALTIVLDNAVKYSGHKATITISAKPLDSSVRVEVSDTGPGIKAVDLEHIFDRFYQAESSRSRQSGGAGGYGLGLSIAKQLMETQHGAIEARSQPGKGSTFSLIFPQPSA